MNPYLGDIAIHLERLVDGTWLRHEPVHFVDKGGSRFRRLQPVPGLAVLGRVDDLPQVALTLAELRAEDWDAGHSCYGILPFSAQGSWDWEAYLASRKTSPRRSPRTFHAGAPSGVLVQEDEAEAALEHASEDEAEAMLAASQDGSSGRVYVDVRWTATHRERTSNFHQLLDEDAAPLGSPDQVRVVFSSVPTD